MDCYISRNYNGFNGAGNKAKSDIEKIMESMSIKNIGLSQTSFKNKIIAFFLTLAGIIKASFFLKKGDNLILQYPLKKYYTFICKIAHIKKAHIITIIHDLGSFRRQALSITKEIKRLNNSDYIITHNKKMSAWLKSNGCKSQLGELEIFDYLSISKPNNKKNKTTDTYTIIYAGALSPRKNNFLYKMDDYISGFTFSLYGNGFLYENIKNTENFIYNGFRPSDELISSALGDFGLVWDGSSIDNCEGDWGNYLQYNNPHKTSLYIRCETPIIIWEKAALANFVLENNIGFCVNSLKEINDKLNSISPEKYNEMCKNIKKISKNISEGYYAKTAIQTAINSFKSIK